MKKYLLICCLMSAFAFTIKGQEVLRVQNGAVITVQSGSELNLQGGITLDNGGAITNNGTIRLNNNTSSNQSDWLDNTASGGLSGTGLVIFNSTNAHAFTGTTSFYDMQMNSVGILTLNNNLPVTNSLNFKTGVIQTGSNYVFLNNSNTTALVNDATNTNYSNSWVNGNLRRLISSNTSVYDFPVGNSTRSNLLQFINNNISGTSYLTASFGTKPGTDAGLNVSENGTAYVAVNDGGVWYLDADVAATGGNYSLQLYFNGFTGLTDNQFGILRRPNASSNAADWEVPVGSSLEASNGAGRKVSDGYARRNNISSFSQWGIGMSSIPLPVTGLELTATRINAVDVEIKWETKTEINNAGFEVQRKRSGETDFVSVRFVPSLAPGGNSSQELRYSFIDQNNDPKTSYYRIKQMDVDGRVSYSDVHPVKGSVVSGELLVWPNPNKGSFYVVGNEKLPAYLYDVHGKLVLRFFLNGGQPVNVERLVAGTYLLVVPNAMDGMTFRQKVVVLK